MSIATERAALFAQGLEIVQREQWGAVQSYTSDRPVQQARWLFLHISVTHRTSNPDADMRTIERIGQDRFGIGISYNAAAFPSGRLAEGQPLRRRGAHTVNNLVNPLFPEGSLNHLARALVLPQMIEDEVTDAQIDAAARWGAALCRAGFAAPGAPWFGHRDVTSKSCPGPIAYRRMAELNRLTRHYEAAGLTAPEAPDMTPAESAKLEKIESYVEGIVNRLNLAQSTLGRILTAIAAVDGVDEAALAGELGPVLAGSIPAVSDSDLERIAKAVADEQSSRLAPDNA